MAERNEKGHFEPGNSIGLRFGEGQKMHTTGRAKNCCASVQEYWNILMEQNDAGESKYTVADLEKIVKSPKSDKKVPTPKRIAAREVLDGLKSGQVGRKVMEFLFDRTQGKARQQIDINANVEAQRVLVMVGDSFLQSPGSLPVEGKLDPPAVAPMPLGGIEAMLSAPDPVEAEPIVAAEAEFSVVNPTTTPPPPLPTQGEPEVIEKPASTIPAPIDLPSPPGRVLGPGETP